MSETMTKKMSRGGSPLRASMSSTKCPSLRAVTSCVRAPPKKVMLEQRKIDYTIIIS